MENLNKSKFRLEEVTKDNPFKVPDNYFDTFSSRLNYRIESVKNGSEKVGFFKIIRPLIGLAASFAAIFGLFYLTNKIVPINTFQKLSNNTNSTVDSYLYSQVDDATLLEFINNEESLTEKLDNAAIEDVLVAYVPDYFIYENN